MSSGTVQKIRTFKADLEAARSHHGATNISESDITTPKVISTTIDIPSNNEVPPVSSTESSVEQEQVKPIIPSDPAATRIPLPEIPKVQPHEEDAPVSKKVITPETKPVMLNTNDTKETMTEEAVSFSAVENTDSEKIKVTDGVITDDIEKGTIVSNKKVGHYGLFRAFKDNVDSWQKNRKKEITARKESEPKVTKVESRIDTLKKAAKTSYRAPQSDHGILLKQLKKRDPQENVKSNIVIKKKDEIPKPHWEHVTEKNNDTEIDNQVKNITPETSPDKKTTPDTKSEKNEPVTKINNVVEEKNKKIVSSQQGPNQASQINEDTKPENQTDKKTIVINKEKPVVKNKKPEVKTKTPSKTEAKSVQSTEKKYRDILRPILIGVIAIICTGAIGTGGWLLVNKLSSTEVVETVLPNQKLILGDADYLINLNNNSDTIFTTVYNHMIESRDLTTHTFVTNNNIEADPNDIVSVLGLRLTGSFARSLTNLTIGSIDGTEPFMVMRATNFDTAFAGMLAWEKSLSIDVSPLFGQPVSESFDPDARTDNQIRSAFYKDAVVANTSVRILRDNTNTSRIIYGFADPNTIIITTNESTYKQLLERLQQQR